MSSDRRQERAIARSMMAIGLAALVTGVVLAVAEQRAYKAQLR
jgi:hypothetical protein